MARNFLPTSADTPAMKPNNPKNWHQQATETIYNGKPMPKFVTTDSKNSSFGVIP